MVPRPFTSSFQHLLGPWLVFSYRETTGLNPYFCCVEEPCLLLRPAPCVSQACGFPGPVALALVTPLPGLCVEGTSQRDKPAGWAAPPRGPSACSWATPPPCVSAPSWQMGPHLLPALCQEEGQGTGRPTKSKPLRQPGDRAQGTNTNRPVISEVFSCFFRRNSRTDGRGRTDPALWFYGKDIRGGSPPRSATPSVGETPHCTRAAYQRQAFYEENQSRRRLWGQAPAPAPSGHALSEAPLQGLLLSRGHR